MDKKKLAAESLRLGMLGKNYANEQVKGKIEEQEKERILASKAGEIEKTSGDGPFAQRTTRAQRWNLSNKKRVGPKRVSLSTSIRSRKL
jgi:hypothetical protein